MKAFDTCCLFQALNNHFFQGNYDYFKYNGKVPLKLETFEEKPQVEIHRYERLSKKFQTQEELENFIVANMLEAKKRMWVGALFGGAADVIYTQWQGRIQSLTYNLVNDIKRILQQSESTKPQEAFNNIFKSEAGMHPPILKAYMRGEFSLESFVLLDMCIGFIGKMARHLTDDRNWLLVRNKSAKYRPFLERLNIDVDSIRKSVYIAVKELENWELPDDKK